jgi:uncharacterized membrane protein YagU involved in acid resistance
MVRSSISAPLSRRDLASILTFLLLFGFCGLYCANAIVHARHAYLQVDEVFTTWMIHAPSLKTALIAGADSEPPGFYLLTAGICKLFGFSLLTLRLQAICCMFLCISAIFVLVRRHASDAIAGAAAVVPLLTGASWTEFFARPHASMMASFALLMLVWTGDNSPSPARWRTFALTAILWFALSMHFYCIVFIPILLLMEAVWSLAHRKVRLQYWAGILSGMAILFVWLPVILPIYRATHSSAKSPGYYAKPSLGGLFRMLAQISFTGHLVEALVGLLCLFGLCFAWKVWKRDGEVHTNLDSSRPLEIGALGLAAYAGFLVPLVTFLFAVFVTRVFNDRYIFATEVGMALGVAIGLMQARFPRAVEPLVLLCVMFPVCLGMVREMRQPPDSLAVFDKVVLSTPGTGPVVLPGAVFFQIAGSLNPTVRNRVTYVLLPPGMQDPDTERQRIAEAWQRIEPNFRIYPFDGFMAAHPHFYLLTVGDEKEALSGYILTHFRTRALSHSDAGTLYEVNQQPARH